MSRRAVLIAALEATQRDLSRTLRRVSPEQARARPDPDGWCIADVVAHLAELEPRCLQRLRRAVDEENPTVAELLPEPQAHALSRSLPELLDAFGAERAATLVFLRGLEQRQWGRPLIHATLGPTRLRDQVQALVTHDNDHLAQILALRERLEAD
jgi:uncharacterized damage-inducible protein DinB